jgi:phospholipid transport system substrate-binding protein
MITNVTINGINLGKTLRNQFLQSAQKNSNDLDFVISSWANEAI